MKALLISLILFAVTSAICAANHERLMKYLENKVLILSLED